MSICVNWLETLNVSFIIQQALQFRGGQSPSRVYLCLSPEQSWDWLQQTHDPEKEEVGIDDLCSKPSIHSLLMLLHHVPCR